MPFFKRNRIHNHSLRRPAACPWDPDKASTETGLRGQAAGRRSKGRSVTKILLIVTIIALVGGFVFGFLNKEKTIKTYELQFAYAPISLNPTEYGDTASVFIGNHIYYRLLPEAERPWIPYVADSISIECLDKSLPNLNKCQWVNITFKPNMFLDCQGNVYSKKDIEEEFYRILKNATWVFPEWKKCVADNQEICVISKYYPDTQRRLKDFAFRFGWLKNKKSAKVFGAGPYCLYSYAGMSDILNGGILVPKVKTAHLPTIRYHVSQDKEKYFDIALYGSVDLLTKNRKNLQNHTPIIYYVITNPNLADYSLPWNTPRIKKIFKDYLIAKDVLFPEDIQLTNISPAGNALDTVSRIKPPDNRKFKLAVPDYLPNCQSFVDRINASWNKGDNVQAYCTDIVQYVSSKVWSKNRDWDAFMVYVSPSSPSRDVIKDNFFSTLSNQSWTYDYPYPERIFYRLGFGQSLATVNKNTVCGLRPDPYAFGDFFITDVIDCEN